MEAYQSLLTFDQLNLVNCGGYLSYQIPNEVTRKFCGGNYFQLEQLIQLNATICC